MRISAEAIVTRESACTAPNPSFHSDYNVGRKPYSLVVNMRSRLKAGAKMQMNLLQSVFVKADLCNTEMMHHLREDA